MSFYLASVIVIEISGAFSLDGTLRKKIKSRPPRLEYCKINKQPRILEYQFSVYGKHFENGD